MLALVEHISKTLHKMSGFPWGMGSIRRWRSRELYRVTIWEWLNWCLKLISKARWYPLSLFSHLLLFDRQAATLTTFYNLQTVLHLKNTWLCLDVLQLRTGGRGWKQRPFIPNRILIHGSSSKGLGLLPQKVNWSLCVIKTAVLTLLNHLAWNLCKM